MTKHMLRSVLNCAIQVIKEVSKVNHDVDRHDDCLDTCRRCFIDNTCEDFLKKIVKHLDYSRSDVARLVPNYNSY